MRKRAYSSAALLSTRNCGDALCVFVFAYCKVGGSMDASVWVIIGWFRVQLIAERPKFCSNLLRRLVDELRGRTINAVAALIDSQPRVRALLYLTFSARSGGLKPCAALVIEESRC